MGNVSQKGVIRNIKTILGGESHGMAITMDDAVLVWGDNNFKQLGITDPNVTMVTNLLPIFIRPFFGGPKAQLATSGRTSFALAPNEPWQPASLFGWGQNTPKLLPDVSASPLMGPPLAIKPPGGAVPLKFMIDIQCSNHHCVALFDDGHVEGWGDNYSGATVLPCPVGNSIYCPFDLDGYLLPDEHVQHIAVSNLHTVLVTNTSSLIVLGKGLWFAPPSGPPPPPELNYNLTRVELNQLPAPCRTEPPPGSVGIRKVVGGLDFTLMLCDKNRIFGFGNNDKFQLGAAGSSKVNVTAAVALNISNVDPEWDSPLPPEETEAIPNDFVTIAAGQSSGYAATADGQVWGWGSSSNWALGIDTYPLKNLPQNLTVHFENLIRTNHTVLGVTAHLSADGAFIRLGERPIGRCPPKPPGMGFGYCDARGFYTFQEGAVGNGTMLMPRGMILVGNVTINGTSDLRFPFGVSMEGHVRLHGRAFAALSDRTELVGDMEIDEESELSVDQGILYVNGSIIVGENATLTFNNVTTGDITIGANVSRREAFERASLDSDALISADGNVTIDGNVTVAISAESVQAMLEAGNRGANRNVSSSVVLVSASSVGSGKIISPTIELLQPTYDSCQTVSASSESDGTTLTVLLSLDSDECTPTPAPTFVAPPSFQPPSTPEPVTYTPDGNTISPDGIITQPDGQTTHPDGTPADVPTPSETPSSTSTEPITKKKSNLVAIVAGSVGGAVAVAVLVTVIVVLAVPSVKASVLPYHQSN
jgi:hypothetical protein